MANEGTIIAGIAASKNGASLNPGLNTAYHTMSGDVMASGVVEATTSAALLDLGPLSAANIGAIWFKNLDNTDDIKISGETGFTAVMQLQIKPQKANVITPNGNTFYIKSTANTPKLYWVAFEA